MSEKIPNGVPTPEEEKRQEKLNLKLGGWNVSGPDYYNWNVGEGGRYKLSLGYIDENGKTWNYERYQFFGNGYGNNNSNAELTVDGYKASEEEWEIFNNAKTEGKFPDSHEIREAVFVSDEDKEMNKKIEKRVEEICATLEKALGRKIEWFEKDTISMVTSDDFNQEDVFTSEESGGSGEQYIKILNEAIEKNDGTKKETIGECEGELERVGFKI